MTKYNFSPMPSFDPIDIERRIRDHNVPLKVLAAESIMPEAFAFKKILMTNTEWTRYYEGIIADKWIEHFLSIYLLKPRRRELMVDMASCWSPFGGIVKNITKAQVYMQDMCFEKGIHKNRIGSDCTDIPLADASVDVISVNNSIEHFEDAKDSQFLQEAFRLLKPGGRLCIVPLFISSVVVNMADPDLDLSSVAFDPGAVLVSAKPWKIPFARYYTPETFVQRLISAVPQFEFEIISIHGMNRFDPSLGYWQFVACLRKPGSSSPDGIFKRLKIRIFGKL